MPALLYDARNVVKGYAMLFYARADTVGLTWPSDDTPLFTPNATGWSNDWSVAGATNEGFKQTVSTETEDTTIEEQSSPVSTDLSARGFKIEAALAEDTLETMKLAYGGGTITVQAASSTLVGKREFTFTDEIDRLAVVLEMRNRYGLARRVIVPEMMAGGDVETGFRRAADKRLYPLALTAVCPMTSIRIVDATAPKTA